MIIDGYQVLRKRIPQKIDRQNDCLRYDSDNLYPQRAKEVLYGSYTLCGILEKNSGFLNGEGFADTSFAELIVYQNDLKKITANILLNKIAEQYSIFRGVALHIGYNLNYQIDTVKAIPFEYCRFGLPDENDGEICKIIYSTNWERDWQKENKSPVFETYDRFNPFKVKDQIESCGGIENYKGQIYYWTPEDNQYPKCSFDSVFDHAQTQEEIGTFSLNSIANGLTAGNIFIYPGKFETDEERNEFKKRMQDHKGAMGANSTMIIEAGTADIKGSELILKTDLQNNDRIFEFTSNYIEKAMLQRYGMPYPILGKMPDSGMFNQQEVKDAYDFYNSVTRDHRNTITDIFEEVFAYWKEPLSGNFEIIPQKYEAAAMVQDATQQTVTAPNATMTNMTGRQNQNYKRMIREYEQGKVNWKQAKLNLQSAFGFSDEEILTLLGDDPDVTNG